MEYSIFKLSNRIILVFIILVAAFLRSYNYFEIPFTHDEFSALFRLNFGSFSELIEKGVKVDGHPAGIQVFLYYWTKLFGYNAWVVKLPFVVFGIASVVLIYAIGKKWFNDTVGLLTSAFMATLQYPIMYSQIARPYISGLFFSLLMGWFWTNIIKNPKSKFYLNSIGFVFAATLCAYNHHFSLLFAAIVGFSGLFMVKREYLVKYVLSGVLIGLLYLPHMSIFLHQLKMGGIEGWLGKPHYDFIISYLGYIFNFSWITMLVALVIFIFGLTQINLKDFKVRHYVLFLSWFLLPLIIGFFYSKYVSAVLQYSVLIFSFSFLFFLIYGHIQLQKPRINLLLVGAIILTNTYSLVVERKHYDLFYSSIYKEVLTDYELLKSNSNSALYIIDSKDDITNYYSLKLGIDTNFIKFNNFDSINEFNEFLKTNSPHYNQLYFGCLSSVNPLAVPVILDYFPHIEWQKNYVGGSTYLFNKCENSTAKPLALLNFEDSDYKMWNSVSTLNIIDTVGYMSHNAYYLDSTMEYGPSFSDKVASLIVNENNFIDLSVKIKALGITDELILVATLESNGKTIFWGGTDIQNFINHSTNHNGWITLNHTVKLSDIYQNYPNIIFKGYLWNKGKNSLIIDDLKINLRSGNPMIYGLNERF